jgi:hypothetical protein
VFAKLRRGGDLHAYFVSLVTLWRELREQLSQVRGNERLLQDRGQRFGRWALNLEPSGPPIAAVLRVVLGPHKILAETGPGGEARGALFEPISPGSSGQLSLAPWALFSPRAILSLREGAL